MTVPPFVLPSVRETLISPHGNQSPTRCHWCEVSADDAPLTEALYEDAGRVMECENESMCRARFDVAV